jgi:hypothetical protein
MRPWRAAAIALFAFLVVVSGAPAASGQGGQPYTAAVGDLEISGSKPILPGASLDLKGKGFASNATVSVKLRSNSTGVDVVATEAVGDATGAIAVALDLQASLAVGSYTVTISGPTPDGGVLELAGAVNVSSDAPPAAPLPPVEGEVVAPSGPPPQTAADVAAAPATEAVESPSVDETPAGGPTPGVGSVTDPEEAPSTALGDNPSDSATDRNSTPAAIWLTPVGLALGVGALVLVRRRRHA